LKNVIKRELASAMPMGAQKLGARNSTGRTIRHGRPLVLTLKLSKTGA
jgi:hypothetical protein